MVAGRSQDSLCEASEVHNEIWQMLLVTHYSFTATRLAAQGAQCSGWKRRFKKSKDESSTTCSDGFERLHSMAIERRSACRVHTIGDLTRFLYIFFYVPNQQGCRDRYYVVDCGRWKATFSAVCGSGASRNRRMNLAPHETALKDFDGYNSEAQYL